MEKNVETNILIVTSMLLSFLYPFQAKQPVGGIKLLEGYAYEAMPSVDTRVATISKKNGLTINIEYGLAGAWAALEDSKDYTWCKEQTINGHKVTVALIKPGLKTVWEPEKPRTKELGNILLITIPLSKDDPDYAANFKAEIANSEEIADTLLMVLTFDPAKVN